MALPGIGDSFGRYRIESRLGYGGMGVVYAAFDTVLERRVALKAMRPELASPDLATRLEAEAGRLARLDSPHVIRIFDAGELQGIPYVATQLVAGGDLGDLMAGTPLPYGVATSILGQVCDALADSHAAGILHRDIKPANVLIRDRSAAEPYVYLCDFGIAHDDQQAGQPEEVGTTGTLAYLAPERARGRHDLAASDIYALGCLLWEMLTGHPPFAGSDAAVLLAHLRQDPPQLDDRHPAAAQVNPVLRHSMAKNPADRYPDPRALFEDLTTPRPGPRTPLPVPRRRAGVFAVAGVVLALVVALAVWRPWQDPHQSGADEADASTTSAPGEAPSSRAAQPMDTAPAAIAGDVSGDGHGDLIATYEASGDRQLLASTGKGFRAPVTLEGSDWPRVIFGDVNGDAKLDAISIRGGGDVRLRVQIRGEDRARRVDTGLTWDDLDAPMQFIVGDYDGDGSDDLAYFAQSTSDLFVSTAENGTLSAPVRWGSLSLWTEGDYPEFHAGDFDGDRKDDLLVHHYGDYQVLPSSGSAFVGTGDLIRTPPSYDPRRVLVADLTGDGRASIIGITVRDNMIDVHTFSLKNLNRKVEHGFRLSRRLPAAGPGEVWEDAEVSVDDYTGDGYADLLVIPTTDALAYDANGKFAVIPSTGSGFGPTQWWGDVPPCPGDYCSLELYPAGTTS